MGGIGMRIGGGRRAVKGRGGWMLELGFRERKVMFTERNNRDVQSHYLPNMILDTLMGY